MVIQQAGMTHGYCFSASAACQLAPTVHCSMTRAYDGKLRSPTQCDQSPYKAIGSGESISISNYQCVTSEITFFCQILFLFLFFSFFVSKYTCRLMYVVVTQDHVGYRLYFVEGQLTQLSNAIDTAILFVRMAVTFRKS